ncbi:MAG: hypothetical protein ACJ74H_17475 [Thermoanaerobaculia bacterium]
MHSVVLVLALLDVSGYVAARGVNATGPASWLERGWGRLEAGGDRDELFGTAQLGVEWTPNEHFDLHVSGVGRHDALGTDAGLVEAYVDGRASFGLDELQVRAGQFFLPTSRENKDELWTSPYTVSFSALNSWIGEEVRPVGVDLQYRHTTSRGHAITTAATAFQGNDSMGALLAWRGWAIGNRLSTYSEVLPLPPVPFFPLQRADGTKPFGSDLDGRLGYSARIRYAVPQRANVLYTYVDNRGDRELHRGEYAWATKFHLLGAEIGNPDRLVAASEYMRGSTTMGRGVAFVDADFFAWYLLVSGKRGRNRLSARYELFNTEEQDFSPAEVNEENGRAWTLTWMFDVTAPLRLAAELTQVVGDRIGTADPDGRSVTIEARYRF